MATLTQWVLTCVIVIVECAYLHISLSLATLTLYISQPLIKENEYFGLLRGRALDDVPGSLTAEQSNRASRPPHEP